MRCEQTQTLLLRFLQRLQCLVQVVAAAGLAATRRFAQLAKQAPGSRQTLAGRNQLPVVVRQSQPTTLTLTMVMMGSARPHCVCPPTLSADSMDRRRRIHDLVLALLEKIELLAEEGHDPARWVSQNRRVRGRYRAVVQSAVAIDALVDQELGGSRLTTVQDCADRVP